MPRSLSLKERMKEREAKRAERLAAAPTCRFEGCEKKVIEEEVGATIRLPKYPEAPWGPLAPEQPVAYIERCEDGHEMMRSVR
jgi:hypothetical protein